MIEGRDIGTVVFPQADVKVYLDAAAEVRSARRAANDSMRGDVMERMVGAATWCLALVAMAAAPAAWSEVLDKTTTAAGMKVQYKVVLPAGYDAAKAYPGILAFGGGPQTMNTVEGVLGRSGEPRED